jgi:hypothetical protein
MSGDIRASWRVADVLGQFFFPAVWIDQAGLDCYTGHRYSYCNALKALAQFDLHSTPITVRDVLGRVAK